MKYLMAIIIALFAIKSNADECIYLGRWTNCGTRDSNDWRYDYQQQLRDQAFMRLEQQYQMEQLQQQDQIRRIQRQMMNLQQGGGYYEY